MSAEDQASATGGSSQSARRLTAEEQLRQLESDLDREGRLQRTLELARAAQGKRRLREARDYYRAALEIDQSQTEAQVQLTTINGQLMRLRFVWIAAGAVVAVLLLAQANRLVRWPESVCNTPNVGGALCEPTALPTRTPTLTPSATPTLTPSATPTLTPSATPTLTPSATPTPVPFTGLLSVDQVAVYKDATSNEFDSQLRVNKQVYLCAKQGERYLVATTYCHLTAPLGWIKARWIEPQFEGHFPENLVTPVPQ